MTPTSPLWVGMEATARPAADGEAGAIGLDAAGAVVAGLLVELDGLDCGETSAVGFDEPPPSVQAAAKTTTAANRAPTLPLPLIFC